MAHGGYYSGDFQHKLPNGIVVFVTRGNIFDVRSNVLVCSTGTTKDLKGSIIEQLKILGGKGYPEYLTKFVKKKVTTLPRQVYKLDSKDLKKDFENVYLAIIEPYKSDMQSIWEYNLRWLYKNVLKQAEADCHKSITIPILGTGNAGGPKDKCIDTIIECIEEHKRNHLLHVNIVSNRSDMEYSIIGKISSRFLSSTSSTGRKPQEPIKKTEDKVHDKPKKRDNPTTNPTKQTEFKQHDVEGSPKPSNPGGSSKTTYQEDYGIKESSGRPNSNKRKVKTNNLLTNHQMGISTTSTEKMEQDLEGYNPKPYYPKEPTYKTHGKDCGTKESRSNSEKPKMSSPTTGTEDMQSSKQHNEEGYLNVRSQFCEHCYELVLGIVVTDTWGHKLCRKCGGENTCTSPLLRESDHGLTEKGKKRGRNNDDTSRPTYENGIGGSTGHYTTSFDNDKQSKSNEQACNQLSRSGRENGGMSNNYAENLRVSHGSRTEQINVCKNCGATGTCSSCLFRKTDELCKECKKKRDEFNYDETRTFKNGTGGSTGDSSHAEQLQHQSKSQDFSRSGRENDSHTEQQKAELKEILCGHCQEKLPIGVKCTKDCCGQSICSECVRTSKVCPNSSFKYDLPTVINVDDDDDDDDIDQPEEEETCPICMDVVQKPKKLSKCGHVFCTECIENCFNLYKPVCPTCGATYGILTGNQPNGVMEVKYFEDSLEGHDHSGHFYINYRFPQGKQGKNHPNPGIIYGTTIRKAYIPASTEGERICKMLVVAFRRRLIFTIGRSTTTGRENVVTWNDIHHKTSQNGGPTYFGYPDPTYLRRVTEELNIKGVTKDDITDIDLYRYSVNKFKVDNY